MTDMTPFEQRLGERLGRELAASVRPFDPAAIAATATVRRSASDRLLNRLAVGPLPMAPTTRRMAMVGLATLLALATVAVAVGITRPGGSRLAFIRPNGDVVVAASDGSGQTVIDRVESPVLFTQLVLAPDGEHLAVVDESFQLVIVDRTGEPTYSTKLESGFSRFEWSPDGQRLAIFDGARLPLEPRSQGYPRIRPDLDLVSVGGGLETALLPADFFFDQFRGDLAWSPDGRWIAVTGSVDTGLLQLPGPSPSTVWILDIANRGFRELTPSEPGARPSTADHRDYHPVWLPDGRLLFTRCNSGLWQVDRETGVSTRIFESIPTLDEGLCGGSSVNPIVPSPDGARLLIDHPAQGLSILDVATGTSLPVRSADGSTLPTSRYRWTMDGKSLVFSFPATPLGMGSVAIIDIATGEQRVLAPDARYFDYVP